MAHVFTDSSTTSDTGYSTSEIEIENMDEDPRTIPDVIESFPDLSMLDRAYNDYLTRDEGKI